MLAFTSVYFLETGLFNGLQPFQLKNFPAPRLRLCTTYLFGVKRRSAKIERLPIRNKYRSMNSGFMQWIYDFLSVADDMSGLGSARSVR
jgi:hypothetical protein